MLVSLPASVPSCRVAALTSELEDPPGACKVGQVRAEPRAVYTLTPSTRSSNDTCERDNRILYGAGPKCYV